jgi:hypothetical protein
MLLCQHLQRIDPVIVHIKFPQLHQFFDWLQRIKLVKLDVELFQAGKIFDSIEAGDVVIVKEQVLKLLVKGQFFYGTDMVMGHHQGF